MALYTFYIYSDKRGTGRAIRTVERDYWSDWLDLKETLREVMVEAAFKYGITKAVITIERLKPGVKRMAYRGYHLEPTISKRERMAMFTVEYNPATMRIKVKRAMLGGDFSDLIEEYYMLEKGIKYKSPPVMPKRKMSLKQIMMMEGSVPTNSYIPVVKPKYCFVNDEEWRKRRHTYVVKPKSYYTMKVK